MSPTDPRRVTMENDERWFDVEELRRPKTYYCWDGMCGATDCARCHPENHGNRGEYLDPDNEETEEEHDNGN